MDRWLPDLIPFQPPTCPDRVPGRAVRYGYPTILSDDQFVIDCLQIDEQPFERPHRAPARALQCKDARNPRRNTRCAAPRGRRTLSPAPRSPPSPRGRDLDQRSAAPHPARRLEHCTKVMPVAAFLSAAIGRPPSSLNLSQTSCIARRHTGSSTSQVERLHLVRDVDGLHTVQDSCIDISFASGRSRRARRRPPAR